MPSKRLSFYRRLVPYYHEPFDSIKKALRPVINSPVYETDLFGEVPILDGIATINEEKEEMTIFAVNRDQESPTSFECDMRNLEGYRIIEHIILEHPDIKARNTRDNPAHVVPHTNGNAVIEDGMVRALLPKLSWNVVRLSKLN